MKEKRNVLYVTPEKFFEYSAFIREARTRIVRPADSEGAEALAEHYRQLDAERCRFFGVENWPRGQLVQVMSAKAAASRRAEELRAATIAELEADYGLVIGSLAR